MLKTWKNGEDARVVQKILENNFKVLGKYLPNNMLALSTSARLGLPSGYLCNKLIVFDTDKESWFQYLNGEWVVYKFKEEKSENLTYAQKIYYSDWVDGQITIPFTTHNITSPLIQVFMLVDGRYEIIFCGTSVDNDFNVVLSSDIQFSGKVVIK